MEACELHSHSLYNYLIFTHIFIFRIRNINFGWICVVEEIRFPYTYQWYIWWWIELLRSITPPCFRREIEKTHIHAWTRFLIVIIKSNLLSTTFTLHDCDLSFACDVNKMNVSYDFKHYEHRQRRSFVKVNINKKLNRHVNLRRVTLFHK